MLKPSIHNKVLPLWNSLRIPSSSMLGQQSRYLLWQWLKTSLQLPGDVVEFGVWKGGSALIMAECLKSNSSPKKLLLLDSFEGMPDPDPVKDNHWKSGDLAVSVDEVTTLLSKYEGVCILKGPFEETMHQLPESISFVHIDCDLYSSVMLATEGCYSRLSRGGAIIYDDYAWADCRGAKMAVDEFYADKAEKPVHLLTSQAVVIKQ